MLIGSFISNSYGQFNRTWQTAGANNHSPSNTSRGWVGIGTQTSSFSSAISTVNHPLHLHGAYVLPIYAEGPPPPTGLIQPNELDPSVLMQTKSNITGVRFGMTNNNTTRDENRGVVFSLIGSDFTLRNREQDGSMLIGTGNARFSLNRVQNNIVFGSRTVSFENMVPSSLKAYTNIHVHNENGLYIRTTATGRYGLSVKVQSDNDIALQCYGTNQNVRNFAVTGNGYVFARRYTTTLNNIPDYVFDPSYQLMPLSDLRSYLNTQRHLPNIPSAAEMESTEVDLGELTRLLLEKIEESTLYILQLEERIKLLEEKK
jgi:hypothetical protein